MTDRYGDYLKLDQILTAQVPWSGQGGQPAHDEMLFIIFHQTYELWFRQILFELDDAQRRFSSKVVYDREMPLILARLERIVAIFRLLVRQLDVLETMTPRDFLDFREALGKASGLQSWQFRMIEVRLGLRRSDRVALPHGQFDDVLDEGHRGPIEQAEGEPNLYDQLDGWLSRTPFVDRGDYKFWEMYRTAVDQMLDAKVKEAEHTLADAALTTERQGIERSRRKFHLIFDEAEHTKGQREGSWRMSWRSLQAALLITLYRQEPMLQMPARLLSLVMDIDELLSLWRYRHALIVQRMMGMAVGTGGSAGYGYLMATLERHRIFTDLYGIATYLIPTRALPPLPESLRSELGYRYQHGQP
jgi:tryptophan 2,3-dioxygenase